MGVQLFTLVHVALSLIGIFTGFVALCGQLNEPRLGKWMGWFLATTVLTNATGFGFPVEHFLPSHALAALSLVILAVALYARYGKKQAGGWGRVFVVSALVALYLNVVVLVIQLFLRVPALHDLAPHQNEWPFLVSQVVVLGAFLVLGAGAVRRA